MPWLFRLDPTLRISFTFFEVAAQEALVFLSSFLPILLISFSPKLISLFKK